MSFINIVNYIFLPVSIFILILELIFYSIYNKILLYCGVTIYKNSYKIKNNFINIIGKVLKKDDIYIKIINEELCFFQSKSTVILGRHYGPIIFGFIKIKNGIVNTNYKKPFSYLILTIIFLINIINIFGVKKIIYIIIFFLFFIGILIFFNYLKVNSMRYDIDYFLNNEK